MGAYLLPPIHLCRFRLRIFRALCFDTSPSTVRRGRGGQPPKKIFDCGVCSFLFCSCAFGAASFSLLFSLPFSLFLSLPPLFSPSLPPFFLLSFPPLSFPLLPSSLCRAPAPQGGYTRDRGLSQVVFGSRRVFKMRSPLPPFPTPPPDPFPSPELVFLSGFVRRPA